jgi:transposase
VLAPWASRCRRTSLDLLDQLTPRIHELTHVLEDIVEKGGSTTADPSRSGPADRTVRIIGRAERFQCGKQIASYLGLVPLEDSSGNRRRLAHITKQGNSLSRFLLVEAAQVTVRRLSEWRSKYVHLTMWRGRKIARVARGAKTGGSTVLDDAPGVGYEQVQKLGSPRGSPGHRDGAQ